MKLFLSPLVIEVAYMNAQFGVFRKSKILSKRAKGKFYPEMKSFN